MAKSSGKFGPWVLVLALVAAAYAVYSYFKASTVTVQTSKGGGPGTSMQVDADALVRLKAGTATKADFAKLGDPFAFEAALSGMTHYCSAEDGHHDGPIASPALTQQAFLYIASRYSNWNGSTNGCDSKVAFLRQSLQTGGRPNPPIWGVNG